MCHTTVTICDVSGKLRVGFLEISQVIWQPHCDDSAAGSLEEIVPTCNIPKMRHNHLYIYIFLLNC